jgi:hypothetical protein
MQAKKRSVKRKAARAAERSNGIRYEQPLYKNSENKEEREKRLKKREALTLKAFRIAYENHHQRKVS